MKPCKSCGVDRNDHNTDRIYDKRVGKYYYRTFCRDCNREDMMHRQRKNRANEDDKKCKCCQKYLPLSEFYNVYKGIDNGPKQAYCKTCQGQNQRVYKKKLKSKLTTEANKVYLESEFYTVVEPRAKECKCCGVKKTVANTRLRLRRYSKNTHHRLYFHTYCAECQDDLSMDYYEENKEKRVKQMVAYNKAIGCGFFHRQWVEDDELDYNEQE